MSKSLEQAGLRVAGSIQSAATPPSQPALPPAPRGDGGVGGHADARARAVREAALNAAIRHAQGYEMNIGTFWHNVRTFEHYISTGEVGL